jgi:hypothetical protein
VKSLDEQLTWAKQRALISVDMGDFADAVTGLRADLAEHPLTQGVMSSDQALRGYKAAMDAAVDNKDRNFTRASLRAFIRTADERLNEYLERLDHGDVEDGATSGGARTKNLAEKIAALGEKRGRYQAMLTQLERTGEGQISLTDPDSRAMAAHTKVGVGYNIQVAVDAKNKLIVEQAVTNQVFDCLKRVTWKRYSQVWSSSW